jgi:hypothetical protein
VQCELLVTDHRSPEASGDHETSGRHVVGLADLAEAAIRELYDLVETELLGQDAAE